MFAGQAGAMTQIDTSDATTPGVDALERRRDQREALKSRHAEHLARLMAQRDDLRGVHALADLVDDAIRWTA
jgi:hypothetical protein